jgi:hypothetical protein
LMVECNRKNGGNRILVIKGIMNLYGKNWVGNLVIIFW